MKYLSEFLEFLDTKKASSFIFSSKMTMSTDLWNLILDIKSRYDAIGTDRQFIFLALASLFCSFIYGYLYDGWIDDELLDSPHIVAQVMFSFVFACFFVFVFVLPQSR